MMTKTTSTTRSILKKLLLAPLFTGLVFLVCVKTVAQEKKTETKLNATTSVTGMEKYFENTVFRTKDENGNIISEKRFSQLTSEEQKNIPPPPPPAKAPTSEQEKSTQLKNLHDAVGPKYVELIVNNKNNNTVYNTVGVDTKPQFPGGMSEFYKFVAENFRISEEASKIKLKGKVYLKFTIEKDGSLSDFSILRDIGYGSGEEAIRVLKLCPNWIPAMVNNKNVRVEYSLPISIHADE